MDKLHGLSYDSISPASTTVPSHNQDVASASSVEPLNLLRTALSALYLYDIHPLLDQFEPTCLFITPNDEIVRGIDAIQDELERFMLAPSMRL